MAQATQEQRSIISEALRVYKDEVAKVLKKAEKLGGDKARVFKQLLLEVEHVRNQFTQEGD